MSDIRRKLIEILYNVPTPEPVVGFRAGKKVMTAGFIANHLIANGVTIPVRCKDCKHYCHDKRHGTICRHPALDFDIECYDHWIEMEPDGFCSYGERREVE